MKRLLAGLVSFMALGADGRAQPNGSRPDVVAALERIRDTGVFPEYLSLEYVELQRAVAEIVEREPYGYVADLASRVLTRVVVNLRQPLLPEGDQPYLEADLLGPPNIGHPDVELQGSIDGGPWKVLTRLGKGQLGRIICDTLGKTACAPGWHALAVRAIVNGPQDPGGQPRWVETRELPTQVYGVYRKSDLMRYPSRPGRSATPAAWMRAAVDVTASSVDAQLAASPLRAWLPAALREAGRSDLASGVRWESRPCGVDMVERFADRSRAPVCITAEAKAGDYELSLEFSVGPLGGDTGRRPWPEVAVFHRGHLTHERGSLDLSRLSELPAAFEKPRKSWPVADLRIRPADILYSPLAPNAGDTVVVEFTVGNDGTQDARALIEFWLNAPGIEQEERLEFVADVPAGKYYRFTRSIKVPYGSATGFAGLQAHLAPPRGSMKQVEEADTTNNDAVQLLGARPTAGVRE